MSIFKKAVQQKVRFDTSKGQMSVEDLYDLPLTSEKGVSLDSIARDVNAQLKSTQEESFVTPVSKGSTLLSLKLELVKEVIADKIADRDAKKAAVENAARKQKLLEALSKKQDQSLEGMSIEDIQKELASL